MITECRREWREQGRMRQLWQRSAALWTGQDEARWLGWLTIVDEQLRHLEPLENFQRWVQAQRFRHVVLIGMGGSSLAADVFARSLPTVSGFPQMWVLDSTVPAQIERVERAIDLASTLFIVASKSGSTLEPNVCCDYFFAAATQALQSPTRAAQHFIAITDPGSQLEALALRHQYAHIFSGVPEIGGRFSALSNFGLVPLACQGVNVRQFLQRAHAMVEACGADSKENPGLDLGLVIGCAAQQGRNKLTLSLSPEIAALGGWLEQLVAESLGKDNQAVIPIDGEPLMDASFYGSDRLFVDVRVRDSADNHESHLRALETAGHPVLRLTLADANDLGAEMFRWEVATAVAGSVMGLNPFNQPDVEATKIETRKLLSKPDAMTAQIPMAHLQQLIYGLGAGDYFALLAYVDMNPTHARILGEVRERILQTRRVATAVEFGPRYLHSTGQAYKGGTNQGAFLLITADDVRDLPVPQLAVSFGQIKMAQALADQRVLQERGRRVVHVHLQSEAELGQLRDIIFQMCEDA